MKIFMFLAVLLVLCGCQTSAPLFSALHSEAQAIAIAKHFDSEHNQSLAGYQRVDASFDSRVEEWHVLFTLPNNTGVEFRVDDKTGAATEAPPARMITTGIRLPPNTALEPTPTAP